MHTHRAGTYSITTLAGDVGLHGRVRLTARNLAVHITAPFIGPTKTSHIPCYVPARYTWNYYGFKCARQILCNLYRQSLALKPHSARLLDEISIWRRQVAPVAIGGGHKAQRFELRRQLKDGGLKKTQYDEALRKIMRDAEQNKRKIIEAEVTFLEAHREVLRDEFVSIDQLASFLVELRESRPAGSFGGDRLST